MATMLWFDLASLAILIGRTTGRHDRARVDRGRGVERRGRHLHTPLRSVQFGTAQLALGHLS
jgi:hypothetical protein